MSKIERLLCHPYRVFVNENCSTLVKEGSEWKYRESELVVIPVDSLVGNPDPFVFYNPWMYGYCRNYNMSSNAGPQSIIIFGTYLINDKGKESFLVDTVFAVEARYNWLGKEDGYWPSETFKNKYKCSKASKLYKDFLIHRVENGEHPKARAIFAAKHIERNNYYELVQIPHRRTDTFYSFIPLMYENGIYKLIDVLPIIKQKYPKLLENYNRRQNKLYNIDSFAINIIDYLIKEANRLVIRTSGKGLPENLDMNLQKKYYKNIYNIDYQDIIEKNCTNVCYIKENDED